jgi:hypothetical protein
MVKLKRYLKMNIIKKQFLLHDLPNTSDNKAL